MRNPFVFGEAVTGQDFCNRKKEVDGLCRDLLDSQKVFFIASRRIGKTSVLKTALHKLREKGVRGIYFDLEGISTYKRFLEAYLNQVTAEFSIGDKILDFMKRVLPGIRIITSIEEDRSVSLSLGYKSYDNDLESIASKIYDLPSKAAMKKRFVVIFDEFQEITKLNGGTIASALRASIQHHRNVGYIFAGSSRYLLSTMASSQDSPFFKMGPVKHLQKIDRDEFLEFIRKKFKKSNFHISEEALDRIMELSQNIPYYVQMLSHEVWDYALRESKRVAGKDVDHVFEECIKEYDSVYRGIWLNLVANKKQALRIIAKEGGRNLFNREKMDKYDLRSASSIQKSLETLMKDGHIDKDGHEYYIDDLLFKEWIVRNTI